MGFPLIALIVGTVIASGTASYVAAKKAAKKAAKASEQQNTGILVNKESNIEQLPVIYGVRRVGGVRVFVSTDGKYKDDGGTDRWHSDYDPDLGTYGTVTDTPTNEYLFVCLALCEGEVQDITDILIDDVPATDSKFSGLVNINVYKGSDSQTNSVDSLGATDILTTQSEDWTSDHRLRGVAYLGMRFKWDEDVFSGIPNVTALVTGRKVYDPRTLTTAWSDNPALCIRDYLTNTRFGKGLSTDAIDDVAFAAAADDCDESVTLYSGGTTGKLFTCNAYLDTSRTIFDNLNSLLLGCRGFLPYTQGQYKLKIDGSSSPVLALTTNELIGGIGIEGEAKEDKYNRVIVTFPNPDANWQSDTAIWPVAGSAEETTYLSEDGGTLLSEELELTTITSYYQARDLARLILSRSRNALKCSIRTTSEALQLEIADVITITHPTPGWTAKPFQVTEMILNDDGTVTLSLLEYDSTLYTWEVGTEQTTYPDTNIPDPTVVASVSNIQVTETTTLGDDGTVIPTGLITWDASYDNLVDNYEIQYKLTSEASTEWKSIFTSQNKYEFYNAAVGTSVDIRIRAINSAGVKGAFTTSAFTVNGDTTAPGVPSGIVATAGYNYNVLDWVNPADKDFARVDVYGSDTSGSGGATLIGSVSGTTFSESNLLAGATRYYYLKSVDFTGNESAFSGEVSATVLTDPLDGEDGADGPRSASGYVYYSTAQATAPTSPTLSGFDFVAGTFSTISAGWSVAATAPTPEEGKSFWAVRYAVSEATFEGTQTVTKSSVFAWQNFDGLVTFTNMNDEFDNNVTVVDGGKITTNSITVDSLSAGSSTVASGRNFYLGSGQVFDVYTTVVGGVATAASTSGIAGQASNGFGVIGVGDGASGSAGFFINNVANNNVTLASDDWALSAVTTNGSLTVGSALTYPNEMVGDFKVTGDIYSTAEVTASTISTVTIDSSGLANFGGSVNAGDGYASGGVTLTFNGAGNFSGAVTVDGNLLVGGGYGSTGMTFQSDGTGYMDGNLIVDGSITAGGNVTAYSDIKLKENLEIIPNAIESVYKLTGYTFDRKDTGDRQTGLIAQDVLSVLPEAVEEHNGTLTVAYGNLVGLLVEAIKDLKDEIEELKNGSPD